MAKVADTTTFIKLAKLADTQQFNRRVTPELIQSLDPVGVHLVYTHAMVSDYHIRCFWYVAVRGSEEPQEVELDVPIGSFNKLVDWEPPDA